MPELLTRQLVEARRQTLAAFEDWRAARPGLRVPLLPTLNPPLWELGHVGWFQERWLLRQPGRELGTRCDPELPLAPPRRPDADALYDSSRVPHDARWSLPLPSAEATLAELAATLDASLAELGRTGADDDSLYLFRLALHHEQMHHEAALSMAQQLALPMPHAPQRPLAAGIDGELQVPAGRHRIGRDGPGFAFDNELGAHEVELPAFAIDAAPVSEARWIAFLEATGREAPPGLRRHHGRWQRRRFERWEELDPDPPALHLSAFDAEAWCAWAGRRLPSEAEWEAAAALHGPAFAWGQAWEWTASPFLPYPGFGPHPYRDYSLPWMDGSRRVLRGASFATADGLRSRHYRNFFEPRRNDLFAGLRSCALR
jgi:gamma-glutamyl hercynylcysteine S-oxide synthase